MSAGSPRPVFVGVPMDEFFRDHFSAANCRLAPRPNPRMQMRSANRRTTRQASRPVLVLGTDVWMDGAGWRTLASSTKLQIPTITNGMGRGLSSRWAPALGDQGCAVKPGQR
ncbi:MAG: hypothetical protein R2709_11835 [Marmoricola sp.]